MNWRSNELCESGTDRVQITGIHTVCEIRNHVQRVCYDIKDEPCLLHIVNKNEPINQRQDGRAVQGARVRLPYHTLSAVSWSRKGRGFESHSCHF